MYSYEQLINCRQCYRIQKLQVNYIIIALIWITVLWLKVNKLYSVGVRFGFYFWNDINVINIIPKSRFKLMSWSGIWEFPQFCHLSCSVLLLPTAVPVKYVVLFFFSFNKQGRCPKSFTYDSPPPQTCQSVHVMGKNHIFVFCSELNPTCMRWILRLTPSMITLLIIVRNLPIWDLFTPDRQQKSHFSVN